MPKNSRQTIAPRPFSTKELGESNWYTIEEMRRHKSDFLVRYLLSKMFFSEEEFTEQDSVVLFLNYERMVATASRDRIYACKYNSELFKFRAILQSLDSIREMEPTYRSWYLREVYRDCLRTTFLSRRMFFSGKGTIKEALVRLKLRWPKRFPPKTFVGRGYGDHGTAKNPAYDGSPAWQEVAMEVGAINEENANLREQEDWYWKNLKVHPLQLHRLSRQP